MTDDRKLTNERPMSTLYPPYVIERLQPRCERTYLLSSPPSLDRIVFRGTQ